MTTSTPEQRYLAALVDGEPGPGGLEVAIRAAERDAELRGRFERAVLIGQALRGEPTFPAARSISGRVADALASEPAMLRPPRPMTARRPVNRPAAALALAASLVAVAILVGPSLLSGPQSGESAPTLAANGSGAGAESGAQPGAKSGPELAGMESEVVAQWSMGDPADSTALDALLVDHRERASASGLTGFIPYAAVVGPSGVR